VRTIIGTVALAAIVLTSATVCAVAVAQARSGSAAAPAQMQSMQMPMGGSSASATALPASQLALARLATAPYANDLNAAKAHGYRILTQLIPGMGYHFINTSIKGFDVRKPPILVYEKHGTRWQLGALEWVFLTKPATPPLAGATYGSFPAACHYDDGTFVPAPNAAACAPKSPKSGSAFNFWHPKLVTMHVWTWYPNPAGLYASMNPLVHAFS
jgi:hypothetical protein